MLTGVGAVALAGYANAGEADVQRVPYTEEAFSAALASGEPLLLDFYAEW